MLAEQYRSGLNKAQFFELLIASDSSAVSYGGSSRTISKLSPDAASVSSSRIESE